MLPAFKLFHRQNVLQEEMQKKKGLANLNPKQLYSTTVYGLLMKRLKAASGLCTRSMAGHCVRRT
jgi:hypothetical protein